MPLVLQPSDRVSIKKGRNLRFDVVEMKYVFYLKRHSDTQTEELAYLAFLNDFHIFYMKRWTLKQ